MIKLVADILLLLLGSVFASYWSYKLLMNQVASTFFNRIILVTAATIAGLGMLNLLLADKSFWFKLLGAVFIGIYVTTGVMGKKEYLENVFKKWNPK